MKIYQVVNPDGKLRFESIDKVKAEFFLRKLLRELKQGDPRPRIVECL